MIDLWRVISTNSGIYIRTWYQYCKIEARFNQLKTIIKTGIWIPKGNKRLKHASFHQFSFSLSFLSLSLLFPMFWYFSEESQSTCWHPFVSEDLYTEIVGILMAFARQNLNSIMVSYLLLARGSAREGFSSKGLSFVTVTSRCIIFYIVWDKMRVIFLIWFPMDIYD